MPDPDTPLRSAPAEDSDEPEESDVEEETEAETEDATTAEPAAPVRRPAPTFKFTTFVYVFLGLLGL